MVLVEIIKDYKCCWRVGMRREVQDHFASVLIEQGYARLADKGGFMDYQLRPEIAEYVKKAEFDKADERSPKMAAVIDWMVGRGIMELPPYQRFVSLVYQLRKIVFI